MTTNEGVGKKIVEALKKQNSADFEIEEEFETEPKNEIESVDYTVDNVDDVLNSNDTEQSSFEENDTQFEIKEEPSFENSFIAEQKGFVFDTQEDKVSNQPQGWQFEEKQEFQPIFREERTFDSAKAKQFEMPANVSVLKKLISQLPTGVTKQTGAQIIKQTMEALGISMNSVLHDAQKVQDDLNESIKSCMMSIQEYKNNIKNLEKQGLDYQRQVNQLNDLISLFILSDKEIL